MINAKKRFINNIIRVGIFVLFACLFFSGVIFAYDYYSIYPGLEMEYKGLTYSCDNNANCTTTDQNENTFNGLFFTSNNYGSNGRAYAFFYDTNNEGYLSQFRGYIGGTYIYSQRSPIQGCFGTYEKAMGDFNNDKVCNWSYNSQNGTNNANTGNTLSWLSDTTLAGQLYSIRFSPFGDQIIICYNYGTGTDSFCFLSQDNQGSNINYGIDFNTAYGQVFSSKLSLLPAGNSPRVSGGGSESGVGTLIPLDSDVDMVINYYEQRGYRESMCYVGTDNLTATFGTSGVSFNEGSGDSIFGLYNSIYNGFGNNIIQNVGKFINVRDINYGQWFYCEGENCPRWLAELTGNDVNINLNYTGLTFPFANKPVAIYFMASNLSETYNIDTHGQDVAFYCYSKLNRDSIADGSIDYSDIREKAGSGVLDKIDTYNQYLIDYYTPKGNFQVPTSGEFWDSFLGEDYSGVNNTDMSDIFSNYFTRITNIFQNYSPLYSTGIIPDWIIFPLIFLILFRIMKH